MLSSGALMDAATRLISGMPKRFDTANQSGCDAGKQRPVSVALMARKIRRTGGPSCLRA